jgi:hypothetical protein
MLHANLCLLIIQEKIFLIQFACTWLKKTLAGNNVLIFAQMVQDPQLEKCMVLLHPLKPIHQNALVASESFTVKHLCEKIPNTMIMVLDEGVKIVNFYKLKTTEISNFHCTL